MSISTDFKNWMDFTDERQTMTNEEIRKIWERLDALEEGGTPPEPAAGCLGGRSDEENG